MGGMTIGQLAKAAGVGVETIRYYQRRALIDVPPRRLGGPRRYPEEMLARLAFIRRGQELGFTLEEISLLLKLHATDCVAGQDFAKAKYAELGARIEALTHMRERLHTCIERCSRAESGMDCPFIAELNGVA
jgi:MerR family mercuric resistance operon transcriptional regulator